MGKDNKEQIIFNRGFYVKDELKYDDTTFVLLCDEYKFYAWGYIYHGVSVYRNTINYIIEDNLHYINGGVDPLFLPEYTIQQTIDPTYKHFYDYKIYFNITDSDYVDLVKNIYHKLKLDRVNVKRP